MSQNAPYLPQATEEHFPPPPSDASLSRLSRFRRSDRESRQERTRRAARAQRRPQDGEAPSNNSLEVEEPQPFVRSYSVRTRRSVGGLENEPVSGCDDSGWRTRNTKTRNQTGENPLISSPSSLAPQLPPPLILAPPLPPRTCFPPLKGSHPKPAARKSKMNNKTKPAVRQSKMNNK